MPGLKWGRSRDSIPISNDMDGPAEEFDPLRERRARTARSTKTPWWWVGGAAALRLACTHAARKTPAAQKTVGAVKDGEGVTVMGGLMTGKRTQSGIKVELKWNRSGIEVESKWNRSGIEELRLEASTTVRRA